MLMSRRTPDGTSAAQGAAVTDASASNSVGSVDLSLSAVGTYGALQAFLLGIEKSARVLDVQNMLVTGSDTGIYNYR